MLDHLQQRDEDESHLLRANVKRRAYHQRQGPNQIHSLANATHQALMTWKLFQSKAFLPGRSSYQEQSIPAPFTKTDSPLVLVGRQEILQIEHMSTAANTPSDNRDASRLSLGVFAAVLICSICRISCLPTKTRGLSVFVKGAGIDCSW